MTDEDILGVVRMTETSTLLEREQLRMTGIYIAETLVLGGVDFFVGYLDHLRAVTAADVTRVLAGWLLDAPCLAVLVEPAVTDAPGAAAGAQDAAWAPLPVDRSVLANGAVLVSQTNPASPLIAIHLTVRGRAMLDRDTAEAGALDLVHRLLEEGYAGCDASCLARELRRLGAVVKMVDDARIPMDDYYTNGRFSFIRIEMRGRARRRGADPADPRDPARDLRPGRLRPRAGRTGDRTGAPAVQRPGHGQPPAGGGPVRRPPAGPAAGRDRRPRCRR